MISPPNRGVPNVYGLVGGDANAVGPNKRPLSSMSPTIVVKDGKNLAGYR
ncbi:gamma-glutamyltranspeptidase [Escherichia coli]|uniref:Gamma-glutamyltranspeptidase n=1 Tax=Escherichia coli TaxID=562 RepID=A0A376RC11_ECOLX|nr:gamma-glutamyltranspeptidase [Escherichia coli]